MTHARTRKESTSKPSTSDKIVTMYVCFTRDMHTEPWLSQTNVSSISVNTSTKTHTRKNNPRSFQSVHSHLPLIHNSGGCNQYGFCSEFECGASLDSTLSIPLGVTKNLREKQKEKKEDFLWQPTWNTLKCSTNDPPPKKRSLICILSISLSEIGPFPGNFCVAFLRR